MNLNLVTFTDFFSIKVEVEGLYRDLKAYFSCHASMILGLEELIRFNTELNYLYKIIRSKVTKYILNNLFRRDKLISVSNKHNRFLN